DSDVRLLSLMTHALEHPDVAVRTAAVSALADAPGPGATALLERALTHSDEATRRAAAREIGRAHVTSAVPALVRLLEHAPAFEHDLALKTEAMDALGALAPDVAAPVLRKLGSHRLALNARARELRQRARRISEHIDSARPAQEEAHDE
ncbi:MAG TPA: HEAT repeat domain-containing protein, partial [Coriobacteriia bacterium]|nr:HEAT repeat domain-containing protein [Coriobacteriia bacterium]